MTPHDSQREYAVQVVRELQQAGFTALWAGGCVRDWLLGRPPADYDVATDARPEQVRKVFGRRRTVPVGASFGVMIVTAPRSEDNVEVATFRSEGPYLDGRRPESVHFCTPEEDAKRRDFTINGMFYDPLQDQVLDFVGGREDLKRKVVRAIGVPHNRFTEDKLRMLRAVRISATLDFELESTTADAIAQMASEITVVSAERIAQELSRMLLCPRRARALESLRTLKLLEETLPELAPVLEEYALTPQPQTHWGKTLRMLSELGECSFELAFAALLHDVPPLADPPSEGEECRKSRAERNAHTVWGICRRLKLANQQSERICWLVKHRHHLWEAPQLPLHELKRLLAEPHAEELIALNRVEAVADGSDLAAVEFSEQYLRNTPREEIDPPALISGDDLIAAGLRPGKTFKTILDEIRDRQLDGEIKTRDQALSAIKRFTSTDE